MPRRPRFSTALAALLVVVAGGAGAQAPAPDTAAGLPLGTRVRVHAANDARLTGTYAGVRGDTLLVRPEAAGGDTAASVTALPFGQVRQVEYSTGRRDRAAGARRGALRGLAIGGIPSLAIVGGVAIAESQDCGEFCGLATIVLGFFGAALTATTTAAGAIIGYNRPTEQWAPADLRRPRVGALVQPAAGGGARLGVRVGW